MTENIPRVITHSQPELFERIIRELPLVPVHIDLELNAHGIPSSHFEKDHLLHFERCMGFSVTPFSRLKLAYSSHLDYFFPESRLGDEVLKLPDSLTETQRAAVIKALIAGSRYHRISLEIKIPAEKGFEKLKDSFLEELLSKSYEIISGEISLLTYGEGNHVDTSLFLFTTTDLYRNVELRRGHGLGEGNDKVLDAYFAEMAERHLRP